MSTRSLVFTVLITLFSCWSSCFGQEEIVEAVDAATFSSAREHLSKLIQFKLEDSKLGLIRNWDKVLERRPKLSEEERLEKEIQKLVQRGFPAEHAKRHAEAMARHQMHGRGMHSAVYVLFKEMCDDLGIQSGGGGGNNESFRYNYRGNKQVFGIRSDGSDIAFQISDTSTNGTEIELFEDDRKLRFRLLQGDSVILFTQTSTCRLTIVHGDIAEVLEAENFLELKKKHPQQVNRLLLPLWKKIGFTGPYGFQKKLSSRPLSRH